MDKKVFPEFTAYNEGFKQIAKYFGACFEGDSKNAEFREYKALSGFLGFVNKDQGDSSAYSGLSFVVFPIAKRKTAEELDEEKKKIEDNETENSQKEEKEDALIGKTFPKNFPQSDDEYFCVVSIGIGTGDLGDDEELANLPYIRRKYLKFKNLAYLNIPVSSSKSFFIKNSIADYDNPLNSLYDKINELEDQYKNSFTFIQDIIKRYSTKLSAAAIITLSNNDLAILEKLKNISENKINGSISKEIEKLGNQRNNFLIILAWLAQYAQIREWDYGGEIKKKRQDEILKKVYIQYPSLLNNNPSVKDITDSLENNKYVVLEGAPGVGKTWYANQIALNYDSYLFTQFHAETNYVDFIGGIKPQLNSNTLIYQYEEGIFTQAILKALEDHKKKVLLIIDEINRANLANVLGPVFYLFEKNTDIRNAEIALQINNNIKRKVDSYFIVSDTNKETDLKSETETSGKKICKIEGNEILLKKLPENLHVLSTMNTADRSLAVVDFALRRRFFWVPLFPQAIIGNNKMLFDLINFNRISSMFEKYASDEELNLQPGQSYFLYNNKILFKDRLKNEIMPLIKEYFNEGFLSKMKEEFSQYYTEITEDYMYR